MTVKTKCGLRFSLQGFFVAVLAVAIAIQLTISYRLWVRSNSAEDSVSILNAEGNVVFSIGHSRSHGWFAHHHHQ